jgi:hypothetical protein
MVTKKQNAIQNFTEIADHTYGFHKRGFIVAFEGYSHTAEEIIGNIIYVQDESGDKEFLDNRRYKKFTVSEDKKWIDYQSQIDIVESRWQGIKRADYRHGFKNIFSLDDFCQIITPRGDLSPIHNKESVFYPWIQEVIAELGIQESEVGLAGSPLLGDQGLHDLDIVFYGNSSELSHLSDKIKNLSKSKNRQVFEYGRSWPLRYLTRRGIVCPFFHLDGNFPIDIGRLILIREAVTWILVVTDITYSIYNPVLLGVESAQEESEQSPSSLIIPHGNMRGEFSVGNTLKVTGSLYSFGSKIVLVARSSDGSPS